MRAEKFGAEKKRNEKSRRILSDGSCRYFFASFFQTFFSGLDRKFCCYFISYSAHRKDAAVSNKTLAFFRHLSNAKDMNGAHSKVVHSSIDFGSF